MGTIQQSMERGAGSDRAADQQTSRKELTEAVKLAIGRILSPVQRGAGVSPDAFDDQISKVIEYDEQARADRSDADTLTGTLQARADRLAQEVLSIAAGERPLPPTAKPVDRIKAALIGSRTDNPGDLLNR